MVIYALMGSEKDDTQLAAQLAALGHPVRLDIVRHLARGSACCVKDLVDRSDLAQSTISQHLKKLLNVGLVKYQTFQQCSWYELNRGEFTKLAMNLDDTLHICCGEDKRVGAGLSCLHAPDESLSEKTYE